MAAVFTLQYGTYSFPNQTFLVTGQVINPDTPINNIRRSDGGKLLQGFLGPRKFSIKGKIYSQDPGTAHNDMINLQRAAYNGGNAAAFQWKSDRNVPNVRLSVEGVQAVPTDPGIYGYMYDVQLVLVAEGAYAQALAATTVTGTRNNATGAETGVNNGNYPTRPIFTFVAGANAFINKLQVLNNSNCMFFNWAGAFVAGQTLVVDCDAGCVLLQVGATMVDAISGFSGNLFFRLEDGGNNALVIAGGTFNYTMVSYDRYFS